MLPFCRRERRCGHCSFVLTSLPHFRWDFRKLSTSITEVSPILLLFWPTGRLEIANPVQETAWPSLFCEIEYVWTTKSYFCALFIFACKLSSCNAGQNEVWKADWSDAADRLIDWFLILARRQHHVVMFTSVSWEHELLARRQTPKFFVLSWTERRKKKVLFQMLGCCIPGQRLRSRCVPGFSSRARIVRASA